MNQMYILIGLIIIITITIIIILLNNNSSSGVKTEVKKAIDETGITSEMFNNIYENFDTTPAPSTRNLKYDTKEEVLSDFENFCKMFFIKLDINLINCNLGSGNNCSVSNTTKANNKLNSINSIINSKKDENGKEFNLTFDYFNQFLKIYLLKLSKDDMSDDHNKTLDLCLLGYLTLEKNYLGDKFKYIYNQDYDPEKNELKIAKISKDNKLTGSALADLPMCSSDPDVRGTNCYYTSAEFIKKYIRTHINKEFKVTDPAIIEDVKKNIDIDTPENIFTQILIGIRSGKNYNEIKNNISKIQENKKTKNQDYIKISKDKIEKIEKVKKEKIDKEKKEKEDKEKKIITQPVKTTPKAK